MEFCRFRTYTPHTSSQDLRPSPENPSLHWQVKVVCRLTHVALLWQGWPWSEQWSVPTEKKNQCQKGYFFLLSFKKEIYSKWLVAGYFSWPGQTLQHSPVTTSCSEAEQFKIGQVFSGSRFLHCIEPSVHLHSTHSFTDSTSPWS